MKKILLVFGVLSLNGIGAYCTAPEKKVVTTNIEKNEALDALAESTKAMIFGIRGYIIAKREPPYYIFTSKRLKDEISECSMYRMEDLPADVIKRLNTGIRLLFERGEIPTCLCPLPDKDGVEAYLMNTDV